MEQNGFVCAAPDNANKMFTPLFASSYSPLFSFPNLVLFRFVFFSVSSHNLCVYVLFVYSVYSPILYLYLYSFFPSCFYLIVLILFSFGFFVSFVACTAQAYDTNLFIPQVFCASYCVYIILFVFGHFTPVSWNEQTQTWAFFSELSVEWKQKKRKTESTRASTQLNVQAK